MAICAELSKTKVTDILKSGWLMTLDGVPNNILIKGFEILMKEKTDNYMPHPGELRGICKSIQLSMRKENALIDNNQPLIDYKNVPEVSNQANKILKNDPKPPKKRFSSIILDETIDFKTGDTKKLITPGHINIKFFSDQCFSRHKKRPIQTKQTFRFWHTFREKDEKGEFKGLSKGYVECLSDKKGAEPITIGYFV